MVRKRRRFRGIEGAIAKVPDESTDLRVKPNQPEAGPHDFVWIESRMPEPDRFEPGLRLRQQIDVSFSCAALEL